MAANEDITPKLHFLIVADSENTDVTSGINPVATDQVLVDDVVESSIGRPRADPYINELVATDAEIARPVQHHPVTRAFKVVVDYIHRKLSVRIIQPEPAVGSRGVNVILIAVKIILRCCGSENRLVGHWISGVTADAKLIGFDVATVMTP